MKRRRNEDDVPTPRRRGRPPKSAKPMKTPKTPKTPKVSGFKVDLLREGAPAGQLGPYATRASAVSDAKALVRMQSGASPDAKLAAHYEGKTVVGYSLSSTRGGPEALSAEISPVAKPVSFAWNRSKAKRGVCKNLPRRDARRR